MFIGTNLLLSGFQKLRFWWGGRFLFHKSKNFILINEFIFINSVGVFNQWNMSGIFKKGTLKVLKHKSCIWIAFRCFTCLQHMCIIQCHLFNIYMYAHNFNPPPECIIIRSFDSPFNGFTKAHKLVIIVFDSFFITLKSILIYF